MSKKEEIKGKAEAKAEAVKAKTKAKGAKTKKKLTGKTAAILFTLALAAVSTGCATQPSRSQTQNFDRCVFNIGADGSTVTPFTGGDGFTQNMVIETGGDETNTQSTKMPETSVTATIPASGGTSALTTAITSLTGGSTSTRATTTGDCADGSCSTP